MSKMSFPVIETNEVVGILHTKYGDFCEVARPAEEDKDVANVWDGCAIVEYKCRLKALKHKRKMLKERHQGMLTLQKNFILGMYYATDCYKNISEEQIQCCERIDKQVYAAYREIEKLDYIIQKKEEEFPIFCQQTVDMRRKIRKRAAEIQSKLENNSTDEEGQ